MGQVGWGFTVKARYDKEHYDKQRYDKEHALSPGGGRLGTGTDYIK